MSELSTLTSLADWGGPVNAGTGCLSCVTHCLRGKTHWFARAATPYRNCLDPEPVEFLCRRVTHFYNSFDIPPDNETCYQYQNGTSEWTRTQVWRWEDGVGEVLESDTYTGSCSTYQGLVCNGVTITDDIVSTMNADGSWTGTRHYTRVDTVHPETNTDTTTSYDSGCPGVGLGTTTVTDTYCIAEQSESQATADIEAAKDSELIWGTGHDAQFPALGCYGDISWGAWFSGDTRDVSFCDLPNPSSPLYRHDQYGRYALRARLNVPDSYYLGQTFELSYDRVIRALGYNIARSGIGPGTTTTSVDCAYSLEQLMTAPDDQWGNMATGDGSWSLFGWGITSVPPYADAPASGFLAASFTRRTKIRFATLSAGVASFVLRRVIVDTRDDTFTTSTETLSTSGTTGADGLNSTAEIYADPADNFRRIYLFLDSTPIGGFAVAKERDGWQGICQLDHVTLQASSQHYRRMKYTQDASSGSTYVAPEGEDPDVVACYESLPWLGFTQTQVWFQDVGTDGALTDWDLLECTGGGNGASWGDEVSPFDPPLFGSISGGGWTVSATSATYSDSGTASGATWANFDRVTETANPRFGGVILSITRETSTSTLYDYVSDAGEVQEGARIYAYAPEPGQSIQLANVHAVGAA